MKEIFIQTARLNQPRRHAAPKLLSLGIAIGYNDRTVDEAEIFLPAQGGKGMGYIESNLLPDENIVYKARLHGIIFWKPLAIVVFGAIFLVIQPIIGMIVLAIGSWP